MKRRWTGHSRLTTAAAGLTLLVAAGGCGGFRQQDSFLDVARPDLERVTGRVGPHLVHVALKKTTPGRERRVGNMILRSPASTRTEAYTGIIVAAGGYVLVPAKFEQDSMQDVDVWIGEEEQSATFTAYDEQLGCSVIQIQTDKPLTPLQLVSDPRLRVGQWLAILNTSGEDGYFMSRTGLFMICGRRPTRYPELVIDGIGPLNRGAPLLNRAGRPVAIGKSGDTAILLSADFCADLEAFIEQSISGESDEDEDKKGYLGACLEPINKDHASFLNVSRSGLWVKHTLPGSPADKAGLQNGDLIIAVDDEPLRYSGRRTQDDFNWRLRRNKLTPFTMTVWRNGETAILTCQREPRPEIPEFESKELGLLVREIDENAYVHRNLTERNGVLVNRVLAGSPASTSSKFGQSLLQKNDVIVEINGVPTPDISSFSTVVEDIRKQQPHALLVKYRRGRVSGFAGLNLNIGSTSNGAKQ